MEPDFQFGKIVIYENEFNKLKLSIYKIIFAYYMKEVLLGKDQTQVFIKSYSRPKGIKLIYTTPPEWGAAKEHETAEKFYKTSCNLVS